MNELLPGKESDPRFQRSRASIIGAVTNLVGELPIEQLSITRVVEAAGVTRPTFYQHFPDVLSAAQEAAFVRLAEAFPGPLERRAAATEPDAELHRRIVAQASPVFVHLAEHRPFYQRVLAAAAGVTFFDKLIAFVASRMLPESLDAGERARGFQEDLTTVMASGMTWLVVRWVSNGALQPSSPAQMATQVADIAMALRPEPDLDSRNADQCPTALDLQT